MKALAVLSAALLAQVLSPQTVEDRAEIGAIVIRNEQTTRTDETTVLEVGGIEVTVHYESTPNHSADGNDPRDIVTITVPDGYIAVPSDFLIDEDSSVVVLIYEALIG